MRDFLQNLMVFILIPVVLLSVVFVFVPATPRAQQSLLFAKLDKDRLLEDTPPQRLILVGGSNLSFGIDSALIQKETGLNPINTAIQATISLIYTLENLLPYIQPGDIVLISAEYSQFFGRNVYGGDELLRTVMDVDRSSIGTLDLNHWINLLPFIPRYSLSKVNPKEYVLEDKEDIGIYERNAFNEYGDVYIHWAYDHSDFSHYGPIDGRLNLHLFSFLQDYEGILFDKGASLYITFPGIQEATFQNMGPQITLVEKALQDHGFQVLGSPERYVMDEFLMYNTAYHLNRMGVVYRTNLLIEDLKNQVKYDTP